MDESARQPPADMDHTPLRQGERTRVPHDISLSEEERTAVRRSLISFMEKGKAPARHPLPFTIPGHAGFWSSVALRTALLACVFLLAGTGVAVAAAETVPGDWLYPLKVEVFEIVRGRFTFTSEGRAAWEAARARRRLQEAGHLAARDTLTDDAWLTLHALFTEHVNEAERRIDVLAREGHAAVSARLGADLESHLEAHRLLQEEMDAVSVDTPATGTASR